MHNLLLDGELRAQAGSSSNGNGASRWGLYLLQALFLLTALIGLDAPFLSAHCERQNQTFDIARHVFHEGWRAVAIPRASFSLPDNPAQPYTICRLEVPFHGLIGWPICAVIKHERAAVRLVSVLFALVSIQLLYRILLHWVKPHVALIGVALWATAPLVLHFGQVPMPDILCTTGMVAAFHFALRGRLVVSSVCFLFAALAKPSVVVFGLPILAALLVIRTPRSWFQAVRLALAWGVLPLLGLLAWLSLDFISPETPWTVLGQIRERGAVGTLIKPHFFLQIVACVFPFGVGLLGMLGLAGALFKSAPLMHPWLKRSIVISVIVYLLTVVRKIPEPQYFLPLLVWISIAASFGVQKWWAKFEAGAGWRFALVAILLAHILIASILTHDLKASRIPDFAAIQTAASLIPPKARVAAVYRHYGASPAVWLDRNVCVIHGKPSFEAELGVMRSLNFSHLLILDIESRHRSHGQAQALALSQQLARVLTAKASSPAWGGAQQAAPSSPARDYCDRHFQKLFESRHVVLYSLTSPKD